MSAAQQGLRVTGAACVLLKWKSSCGLLGSAHGESQQRQIEVHAFAELMWIMSGISLLFIGNEQAGYRTIQEAMRTYQSL